MCDDHELIIAQEMGISCVATWLWISLLIGSVLSRNSKYNRSGNFIKQFWDGPDGKCEPEYDNGYNRDGCALGWIKKEATSFNRVTSAYRSSCRYFQRATTYWCPKSKFMNTSVVCWKKVTAYMITPSCSGTWLNWGKCDVECGTGKKKRVKFVGSASSGYTKVEEYRPCTIRACGQWTKWSDAVTKCDGATCTKVSERRCIYNNSIAQIHFCSPRLTKSNTTVDKLEMPCSSSECIVTTEKTRAFESTTTTVERLETTVTHVLNDSSTKETLNPLRSDKTANIQEEKSGSVWQGIVIGFLIASCLYALICFLLYKRRFRTVPNESSAYYYNGKQVKPEIIEQVRSELIKDTNMTSYHAMRAATLPLPDNRVRVENSQLETAFSSFSHLNRRCDEEIEPLYSDIPAFQTNANTHGYEGDTDCGDGGEFDVRSEESETDVPQPDMFDDDSFDSDEGRDVLRTLRRPSTKLKHRGSSLRNNVQENASFRSDEGNTSNDHCTSHDASNSKMSFKSSNKRDQPVQSEFQWIGGDHYGSSEIHSDQGPEGSVSHRRTDVRHPSCSSITSLNLDATTSGYNSSVLEESTDDEYAVWMKSKPAISRKSRFKHSAKMIRRKLSKHRNSRRSLSPSSGAPTLNFATQNWEMQPVPKHSSTDMLLPDHNQSETAVNSSCDKQHFMTMRPSQQRTFSVISRNGRLVSVEDIYSLPADAQNTSSKSPYAGYNVPIDAISRHKPSQS